MQHSLQACWTEKCSLGSAWSVQRSWLWSLVHQNKEMPSEHSWAQSELKPRFWKKSADIFGLYWMGYWNVVGTCMCRISFQTSCKRMNIVSPGLSCAGSVGAFIEAIESFCKFCPKLNIQKVLLPGAEDPGRENANLLMGRVMKNWKDLQHEEKKMNQF